MVLTPALLTLLNTVSQQVHDLLSEELQLADKQSSNAVSSDIGAETVSGTVSGTPPPLATFDSWGDDQKRLQEADSSVGGAIDDDDDDELEPLSELDEITLVSAATMCNTFFGCCRWCYLLLLVLPLYWQ
jgi:hypothetical protein